MNNEERPTPTFLVIPESDVTLAVTPRPGRFSNARTEADIASPGLRTSAPATIAAAIGCSERASTAAASQSAASAFVLALVMTSTNSIRPSVSVPVLSSTATSTRRVCSRTLPPLMMMPNCAPRPVPTMIAVGVASPSAQGQAIMRTATAAENVSCTEFPVTVHPMMVAIAIANTIGTKTPATRSARR